VSLTSFSFVNTDSSACRIGILGFGTVGSAVARRLARNDLNGITLTHVCDRRAEFKQRLCVRAFRTLTAWVAPPIVPHGSLFHRTTGPRNAAVISGVYAGPVEIAGVGAGGDATAVAVLSDVTAIARDRAAIVPAPVLSVPQVVLGVPGSAERRDSEFAILNSDSPILNSDSPIPTSEFPMPNSFAEAV
jgi:homoserine dehydrogenase